MRKQQIFTLLFFIIYLIIFVWIAFDAFDDKKYFLVLLVFSPLVIYPLIQLWILSGKKYENSSVGKALVLVIVIPTISTSLFFFDGAIPFFYNSEIVGISFENGTAGASGITELDLIWINAAGVEQGSIFSTTPKIASTAQNKAVVLRNLVTGNDSGPTTGITLPVLSKTTFLEGESVYAKLNSAMSGAINCGISVFYRPIN